MEIRAIVRSVWVVWMGLIAGCSSESATDTRRDTGADAEPDAGTDAEADPYGDVGVDEFKPDTGVDRDGSGDSTLLDDVVWDASEPAPCTVHASGTRTDLDRTIAGGNWDDRKYDLFVPDGYDCHVPTKVIIAIHGGGANKLHMERLSCPEEHPLPPPADVNSPGCLNARAAAANMVVVYPDGTGAQPGAKIRTWNAASVGDDVSPLNCTSSFACVNNVDDIGYVNDLLDDVAAVINVGKVYATGFSNGAAMAHRLGCELSHRIEAVAPVSGGNQFAATVGCAPSRAVSVLHIHGTHDESWLYLGGESGLDSGDKVGIPAHTPVDVTPSSMGSWIATNGCNPTPAVVEETGYTKYVYGNCQDQADVELAEISEGGHTWPGGWQYAGVSTVGETSREFDATMAIVQFFAAH